MSKVGMLLLGLISVASFEARAAVGTFEVTDGASLGGSGTIAADVTFAAGSTCSVVVAEGSLDVEGALVVTDAILDLNEAVLSAPTTVISSDSLTGTFDGLPEATAIGTTGYFIHYINVAGASEVLINQNSTPTSSGIDLRAYQGADGIYVEFVAFDVESDGQIQLALLNDQGAVVWRGAVAATAGPEFIARFKVPGLAVGQPYDFKVRDEVGTWWTASAVKVGGFKAEMVSMSLSGATISFDTVAGREYEVQWTASLSGEWRTIDTVVAEGPITSVEVAFPEPGKPAGFFRARTR